MVEYPQPQISTVRTVIITQDEKASMSFFVWGGGGSYFVVSLGKHGG